MPKIFRIRFIPSENIDISTDSILYLDSRYLITEWKPIRPRNDFLSGISCVFFREGWKISAIIDQNNNILYWYCDIIEIEYKKDEDSYYFYDLLTDIKIYPDGRVEVLDLDELAEAFEDGLISPAQLTMSLKQSSKLLSFIYETDVPSHVLEIIKNHTDWECKIV